MKNNINNIFKQLGYEVSNSPLSEKSKKLSVLQINNSDGSIRWLWPSNLKSPLFLKFYNAGSSRSSVYALLIELIFKFRLSGFFFTKSDLYIERSTEKTNFNAFESWAIFTGTQGPNNKLLIYQISNNKSCFYKQSLNTLSKNLIKNEQKTLKVLNDLNIQSFEVPKILHSDENSFCITDVSSNAKRSNVFSQLHWNALNELHQQTKGKIHLSELESWKQLKKEFKELTENHHNRMPKGLIKKLGLLLNSIEEEKEIFVDLSHGDFTPWNMFQKNNKLYVYDWELSKNTRPMGFDFYHFIFQQSILVDHKSWNFIQKEIYKQITKSGYNTYATQLDTQQHLYLKLYLLYNCIYYLQLYTQQTNWHFQIYWLFKVWNEALSDLLKFNYPRRKLLLMDVFDFLSNQSYAAIKFPNMQPENLDELSDIDLLINRKDKKELVLFFKTHPLVNKLVLVNRSFMSSIQIDNGLLNLDLIWKFKRGAHEFLNAENVLKNRYANNFGVSMMNVTDTARYIGLFYSLNKASIPKKYSGYEEVIENSETLMDNILFAYYLDEVNSYETILKYIKGQQMNKGFLGMKNKVEYFKDVLFSFFEFNGTVITFSGVDGSGKSTVIKHLKYIVEKKMRKRVIVLRHRPSLFPILSAFVKGKKEAEQSASMTLPRLGKNKSLISSLLRFAYYYLDYLIGQLLIQIKYVARGYVVIYDRYYYDFMHDSKRSNIELPSIIFKICFKLIMKPKYNFFLYASVDDILKRKQELDSNTIEQLTQCYLNSFKAMGNKYTGNKFIAIHNQHLSQTLEKVIENMALNAA
jgi:thymidylate kinase/tRNA A-37 threonylcarbamoyl transferase component Bud32